MTIIVPEQTVRSSQPKGFVEVNWNHPLLVGATLVWTPFGAQSRSKKQVPTRNRTRQVRDSVSPDFNGSSVTESLSAFGVASSSQSRFVICSADVIGASQTAVGSGNNGLGIRLSSGGQIEVVVTGVAVAASGSFCSANERVFLGASSSGGTTAKAYKNGIDVTTGPASATLSASSPAIGSNGSAAQFWDGTIELAIYWDGRVVPAWVFAELYRNPWQIFEEISTPLFIPIAAVGATYTLTAESGGFTLTGVANSLLAARLLSASTGSFSLTGNAASLLYNRALVAQVGTFSLTGNSVNLLFNRVLQGNTGAFTLTGNAANLVYTPFGVTYTLTAETGSFNLDGKIASLLANRVLRAQVGDFDLTGNDAGLYLVIPGSGPVLYLDLISKKVMLLQRLN